MIYVVINQDGTVPIVFVVDGVPVDVALELLFEYVLDERSSSLVTEANTASLLLLRWLRKLPEVFLEIELSKQ